MATATNDNVVDFGNAGSAWGTVTHYGAWFGTNFLGSTALTTSRVVANGAAVTFPVGDLTIQSVPGEFSSYASRRALSGAIGTTSVNRQPAHGRAGNERYGQRGLRHRLRARERGSGRLHNHGPLVRMAHRCLRCGLEVKETARGSKVQCPVCGFREGCC